MIHIDVKNNFPIHMQCKIDSVFFFVYLCVQFVWFSGDHLSSLGWSDIEHSLVHSSIRLTEVEDTNKACGPV